MNKITLIYGLPFCGQREKLLALLAKRLSSSPGAPTYVLVPTHQAAVDFNSSLLGACESGAAVGLRIGTTELTARLMYSLLSRHERPMTSLEKEAAIASLLRSSYFPKLGALAGIGGVRRRLAGFVSLVKRGLRAPKLVGEALTRKRRVARAWEGELEPFLLAYDQWVSERSLIDPDDLTLAVADAFESGELKLSHDSLAVVHGFFHLSPLELCFVKSLLTAAGEGILTLDYHPDADEELSASEKLFHKVKGFASSEVSLNDGGDWPQSLFLGPSTGGQTSADHLEVSEQFDIRGEVESVASSVKKLLRSNPALRPSSIKIVANELDSYGPLFREVFSQYGIPLRIPAGRRLIDSPVVAAALALLEAPLQNFSRHSVLRIVSMPFVEVPAGEGRLSAELLDRIARAARVVEGFDEWRERLRQLQGVLELEAERDPEYHDSVEREVERLREEPGAQGFAGVEDAVLEMLGRLKSLGKPLTPGEFYERYVEQLEYFGITRLAGAAGGEAPEFRRLLTETMLSLSRLLEVLSELVSALELCSSSPRPLDDYYQLVRSAISSERVEEARPTADAVELHWGSQTATIPADYVFVVGATESSFPGVEPSVALQPAEELRELGLLTEPPYHAQSRFLFYSYVASARKRARVSWAGSGGRALLLRSPFVDEIEEMASLDCTAGKARQAEPPALETLAGVCTWLGEMAGRGEPRGMLAPLVGALARQRPEVIRGLVRGLASWHVRVTSPGLSPYDGVVVAPDLRGALRERFGEAAFAVTSLERYADCPYKFFLERILGLVPPGEPEEAVSPLNWGSVVHRALRRFMVGRRRGGRPIPVFARIPGPEENPAGFRDVLAEMKLIVEEEISRLPHRADDAYFLSLRDNLLGAAGPFEEGGFVEAFVRGEAERQALGFAPVYFELYFGSSPPPKGSDNLLTGPALGISGSVGGSPFSIRVFGEIDRVDLLGGTGVVVYDYKTGAANPPGKAAVRDGTALQPPIYLTAASRLLHDAGVEGAEPFAGAYYRARDSRRAGPDFILYARPVPGITPSPTSRTRKEGEFQELLMQAARFALAYGYGIVSGLFPPAPKGGGGACRYCDYGSVCRRGELEVFNIEFPVAVDDVALES